MEAERRREKGEQRFSEKNTPYNIKLKRAKEAAEARENSPALMALYNLFLPGAGVRRGLPKYMTDKYGNRIKTGITITRDVSGSEKVDE